ncbi:MAG TPA: efflux RND transporter periplasmic adaptor subunit [Blastocatellia bacterium]|nr:efflux RND transporter periplasmic adaptor subunit [Blastocatellia bacterium]
MLKKLRTKHLIIIAVLTLLGVVLGFRIFQAVKSEAQPTRGGGGERVQTVQTANAERGIIGEKIILTGALKAKDQVDVTPKASGRLTQIKVDTGHNVARGALLAVIEDAEIQQQVARAGASIAVSAASVAQRQAELNNAKADLDRNQRLLDSGLISRQQFEAAQTRYEVTKSQLDLAVAQRRQSEAEQRELKIQQGQTRVYAPMSGAVAKRHVDVGAMVNPSVPIMTVVSLSTMVIQANASERDIARIRPGVTATVTLDSLPGQQYQGRVMRISPMLDPATRNGIIEIEIANRDGALKGEMFARAELNLTSARETILIPRDALVYRGEQPGVYMIDNDVAKFRNVETGLTEGEKVEVTNGLKEGETIVTRGTNLLKDGDRVRVMGAQPGGRQDRP